MNKTFTVSEEYEILTPQKRLTYLITLEEWDFIKNKIDSIRDQINIYFIIGGTSFGVALSSFTNALIGNFPKTLQNTMSTPHIICWAVFTVTLLLSGMAFYFGKKHGELLTTRAKDIIGLMNLIEQKYKDPIQKDGNDKYENYVNEKISASPKSQTV